MAFADEVMLPKLDLDEKKQRILELEGQVCFLINDILGKLEFWRPNDTQSLELNGACI